MNTRFVSADRRTALALAALAGWVTGCSPAPQPPLATTVCDLPGNAQRTVQIDATVSVDAEGKTLISDARCPATRIELRLSAAGSRTGGADRLKSAAQQAVGSGNASFSIRLTGVYTPVPPDAYFIADSVAPVPLPPGASQGLRPTARKTG